MPRYTIPEIAEKLGVDKEIARGLVKFLVEIDLAQLKGERPQERGKPFQVYSFSDGFEKAMHAFVKRGKLTE